MPKRRLAGALVFAEKCGVQARFLLGPAGSGKTFRCLAEIRAELAREDNPLPLVLITPKQATFQLERQLLADGGLAGFTRLQIVSFERLAKFILDEFAETPPRLIADEGRLMVLRALLARHHGDLRLFRATARLPGFAAQLSLLLREFQRHQLAPARLWNLAELDTLDDALRAKLHDFALVLRAYEDWLREHGLRDGNEILDLATRVLLDAATPRADAPTVRLAGLWLDGFAEMTPQELDLLAALVPFCERATLAFCLEGVPVEEPGWLSTWSIVAQTFRRCHVRLASAAGVRVAIEELPRVAERGRFAASPVLRHLEAHWTSPRAFRAEEKLSVTDDAICHALRMVLCANPEAEAVRAAREIVRHVRAGGRYRECAVLVRQLRGYDRALRRVFTRYEIPYFLDQREPVAHHPLAELTRFALRVAAFGWRNEDWFGALKTGLAGASDREIDSLENLALKHGWEGARWRGQLRVPENPADEESVEELRSRLVAPFAALEESVRGAITGTALAAAVRELWSALDVGAELERWSATKIASEKFQINEAMHHTVWTQMTEWLVNLELAFAREAMPLREWLPVLESGLGSLSVGVIPPALDQVLVGTIDRSRNPELKLALVLGLNESVFPAAPAPAVLLTDDERLELERRDVYLGPDRRQRLGHERYFGYIACTRSGARLVLSCAAGDADGKALNASPFLAHIRRLFPQLPEELKAEPAPTCREAEHANELFAPLLQLDSRLPLERDWANEAWSGTVVTRDMNAMLNRGRALRAVSGDAALPPALVEQIIGNELRTSVSALEDFAACPFKFFVSRTLRGEEREEFVVDPRLTGEFQHELMSRFQRAVRDSGRRWRGVSPDEARCIVGELGAALLPEFHEGVFCADASSEFVAHGLIEELQRLVAVLVVWARHCEFEPTAVEVGFGLGDTATVLPGWRVPLDAQHALVLRGRIDRIDLCRADDAASPALAIVIDYKSSRRNFEPLLLDQGFDLQLPAYLAALRHLGNLSAALGVSEIRAAGLFYLAFRGAAKPGPTRAEARSDGGAAEREVFQHLGRFDGGALRRLDSREGVKKGEQFRYSLTKDGSFAKRGCDALAAQDFSALLARVEGHLREHGRRIFLGEISVAPYRLKRETACDFCRLRAVCRFDEWTDEFRILRPEAKEEATE